jgi:EmrB/QacA subfamily drug resistance transporter
VKVASPEAPAVEISRRDRRVVATIYVAVMFMSVLDITIVQIGFGAIAADLGASTSAMSWVATGYLLSLALSIPVSGWLGDRYGARPVLLAAIAIFTVASAACALATSIGWLIAFRVLKGVGGGLLAPVGQALLYRTYPPERRAMIARTLIIPTLVAPALGPIVGGFLIDDLSWRLMFVINVPIGVCALAFGMWTLPRTDGDRGRPLDVAGFLLAGGALASTLLWLSELPARGWSSPATIGSGIAAVVLTIGLVRVERASPAPLLPPHLLRDRLFRSTMLVSACGTAGFHAVLYLMPLALQEGRGLPALTSGLTTCPEAVGMILAAQVAARRYATSGPTALLIVGLGTAGLAFLTMTQLDDSTSLWIVRATMFAAGVGMGAVNVALQAATFARVSNDDMGRATAMFNAQRQTAAAFGVAIVLTLVGSMQAAAGGRLADVTFGPVFIVPAALAALGLVCTRFVRDEDAWPTLGPALRSRLATARPT